MLKLNNERANRSSVESKLSLSEVAIFPQSFLMIPNNDSSSKGDVCFKS